MRPTPLPRFAAVVPIGNSDPRLKSSLRSLQIQNVDMDVALMDASNDGSVHHIADSFSSLLTFRKHATDAGQASAIMEGWKQIQGDILFWLNADDVLLPGTIATVAEVFCSSPEIDIVYGHSIILDSHAQLTGYHMAVEEISDLILRSNTISQPSCFVRRRAINEIGGINPDLEFVMDWDLWVRLYRAGKIFHFIDKPLSAVVFEKGTKTASIKLRRLSEAFALSRRYSGTWAALKTVIGIALHHLGAYTVMASLGSQMRSIRHRKTQKFIFGIGRDGQIDGEAQIPLPNLADEAKQRISIHLDTRNSDDVSVTAGNNTGKNVGDDNTLVTLERAIDPGEVQWLSFKSPTGQQTRFSYACWR